MKNILKNFWVTLTRFKVASVLNLLGLSIAFAVFVLLASQVWWEVSYNRSIKDHERIYRLMHVVNNSGDSYLFGTPPALGNEVGTTIPEVEAFGAITRSNEVEFSLLGDEHKFKQISVSTSSSIPKLFGLECLQGSFEDYNAEKTAILPDELSEKLFVGKSPIGELIVAGMDTLRVVAVYETLPINTVLSDAVLTNYGTSADNYRRTFWHQHYYKLREGSDHTQTMKSMSAGFKEVDEFFNVTNEELNTVILEPIADMMFSPYIPNGNMTVTIILIFVAIVIVLLGVINYLNFFMSLVPVRIRAVNINKVFGAPIAALRANIIFEAMFFMLLSYAISILWLSAAEDSVIKGLLSTSYELADMLPIILMGAILIVLLGVSIGIFPAYYITKFKPTLTLKGSFGRTKAGRIHRAILSSFQFIVSYVFAVIAFFVILQNNYLMSFDYGFERDRIVGMMFPPQHLDALSSELLKNPDIEDFTASNYSIFNPYIVMDSETIGDIELKYQTFQIQTNFLDVLGIELIEGEGFKKGSSGEAIISKFMADKYGLKIGDQLDSRTMTIIGIVSNFHSATLHHEATPVVFATYHKDILPNFQQAYIRLSPTADFAEVQDYIAETLQSIDPFTNVERFKAQTMNQHIEDLYRADHNNQDIIMLFSIITFIISLMGIFGMVLFDMQYRHREIALRKIYGSSVWGLLLRFNRSVLVTLAVSFSLAVPLAIWGINWLLEGFKYRVDLHIWAFATVFIIIALLVVGVVSVQCYSVIRSNPVKYLKSE